MCFFLVFIAVVALHNVLMVAVGFPFSIGVIMLTGCGDSFGLGCAASTGVGAYAVSAGRSLGYLAFAPNVSDVFNIAAIGTGALVLIIIVLFNSAE